MPRRALLGRLLFLDTLRYVAATCNVLLTGGVSRIMADVEEGGQVVANALAGAPVAWSPYPDSERTFPGLRRMSQRTVSTFYLSEFLGIAN